MKQKAIMLILCCLTILTQAQVRLPHIFGDNMVLQREKPIAVWGWANAKEKISVKFHGQTKTTVTDKNGKWKISLNPEKAGGPYELIVSGKSIVSIKNVLVGEVWICSGQSNMEWPLRATNNAEHEIAQANFPNIRHIKIPNIIASTPREDFQSGDWKVCSPETVADFTAVGYYFAAKLSKNLMFQ
jgi:sialate O-acetylesterase